MNSGTSAFVWFSAPVRFNQTPTDAAGLAAVLEARRNDLTEAAQALVPEIGIVLEHLAVLPGALIARMSGSGATCFALFADRAAALQAAAMLAGAEPGWWSAGGALLRWARDGSRSAGLRTGDADGTLRGQVGTEVAQPWS